MSGIAEKYTSQSIIEGQSGPTNVPQPFGSFPAYQKIIDLYAKVSNHEDTSGELNELVLEALKIPNESHPKSRSCSDTEENVIHLEGEPRTDEVMEFSKFCKNKNLIRTDNLGNVAGHRGYFTKGPLSVLEQALIKLTVSQLQKRGFEIISVPDILFPHVIESCGMATKGDRNQVYFLDNDQDAQESCLSGTAEMAIGGFLQNSVFSVDQLPLKLAAVSRCFRAETSSLEEEGGLYRVHYFTKVEMFGVTASENGNESNELHEDFLRIQKELFQQYNLHYRVLEMPPSELGLSAHRKFDIEAWLPGKKMFGEISSCSNCTDFQSRRLNLRYQSPSGQLKFVHTVNGTACAIPRMLISLVETHQTPAGTVELPSKIEEFMVSPWSELVASNPNIEFNFLRTKAQQDRVTSEYV
ncbi:unnamed protein product [Allacma fusca]|uniref:serine--tRNA ligase n=1 Tax=Allacma fusca TaxID=39272 RepID=A0A8J2P2K8_9HEXA|nr:unnamed protein product [Allacma fusca]